MNAKMVRIGHNAKELIADLSFASSKVTDDDIHFLELQLRKISIEWKQLLVLHR
jgi:hypothetical protein